MIVRMIVLLSILLCTTNYSRAMHSCLAADMGERDNDKETVRILDETYQRKEKGRSEIRDQAEKPSKKSIKETNETRMPFMEILVKAGKSAIGGGIPGAIAGVIQVFSLMWLRTIVNYQCRYGTSLRQSIATLYNQGGIQRFYRGLGFALIQAPLSRFVSTAANDGVNTLLGNLRLTELWGPGRTTLIASFVVGIWRMILMPIDTCKTVLQVESVEGFRNLMKKVEEGNINLLYAGCLANFVFSMMSHYPWFYTYNFLSRSIFILNAFKNKLIRRAVVGFLASVVSDSFSNIIRVIKTTKQAFASKRSVSYNEVVNMILAVDGWKGLFVRGLSTRILGNAIQSILFTVVWRGLAEKWNNDK